jgi:hypothetical protein
MTAEIHDRPAPASGGRSSPSCALGLFANRADDAPSFFTILFLGPILVPAMLTEIA